jgi:ferritin-like metal-binding protein YciE
MSLTSLQDVFVEQLKDVYSAETQIVKALPKLAKTVSSTELQEALKKHLEETKTQVERLDQVLEMVSATGKGKKCKGMEGLLEEGKETLGEKGDASPAALDAAIIADCQRVEHYEIAAYGTLCAYAKQLGHRDALQLLKETLSQIASSVNLEAAEPGDTKTAGSARGRKTRTGTGM